MTFILFMACWFAAAIVFAAGYSVIRCRQERKASSAPIPTVVRYGDFGEYVTEKDQAFQLREAVRLSTLTGNDYEKALEE